MDLTKLVEKNGKVLTELLDLLPVPVFYKNKEGIYLGCNKEFEKILNLSREDILGKTSFELYPKQLADCHFQKDNELFKQPGLQIYDGTLILRNGESSIFRYHKASFTNEDGKIMGLIGVAFNIKQEKTLEKFANYDCLTGLLNRRIGLELLNKSINECKNKTSFLSVVLMDIDYFKQINDTYGHNFGDQVLKKISQILKDNLRENDIIFRYGGEEFIYVLPNTSKEKAFFISERIRKNIFTIFSDYDLKIQKGISASFGISLFPNNGTTINQLINKADSAMYKIKKNGRNGVGVAIE
ncbi:GGDEF domain-containing protein [Psychrilyobacter atlanticus]|uniref:GGDEF domain-containing protein n=1 Tax=Psychrilyobacter atlanticus TaxID=271091 RepID=UPI0003F4D63D|nr:GGDEF domain-containing protein [Psychrilyobacter atlanticus]